MLKRVILALLLAKLVLAQDPIAVDKVQCKGPLPKDFTCAILFDVDPEFADQGIDVASVVGGNNVYVRPVPVLREIRVVIGDTLYTAVYDPPLKRPSEFRVGGGIPARVDGDKLYIRWPDGKETIPSIVRRDKINPDRPQSA